MKGKGLVPLLVIALILIGLVIWKKTSAPTRTLSEQVDLVQLLPDDIEGSDIGKLELYSGATPDEKVTLVRDDADWRVESHFNAPVAETKIDEYLEALEGLQGEFREEAASNEGLQPFDLTDDTAFHVIGYAKDATDPAFHLLVGKAADFRTVFMRASDQNTVYVEDTNLRQLAGVYGEESETAPTASPWLDRTILELEEDAITKVEITTPDKSLTFEKQEPAPEPEDAPAEGEDATEDAATPGPEPEPEATWELASGGPGAEVKESGIQTLVRKFTSLSASDIVDPAKTADYGLESPGFKATIHTKEGDPVILEGGRGEDGTDGYVRLASAGEGRVYKLDSYTFGQVFPKGSTLFTLEGFTYPDDAIDRIEVKQPEGDFTVVRSGDTWTVESPSAALPVQATAIDTLESMLQLWKPEDYADSTAGTGLDNPARSVTFSVGGGESVTVAVGDASKTFDGYYAKVEGQDKVLAMSKADYQKAFIEPKNLYQLKLVDATASDVHAIAVERADDAFTLVQTDGDWSFSNGPADATLDQDKTSDLVNALVGLQASGIITGERAPGTPVATIRVTTQDGTSTYVVEAEHDGRYPVVLVERNQPVWVDKAELDAVLVASESLTLAPEPAADAAAPPAAIEAPAAPVDAVPAIPEVPAATVDIPLPEAAAPAESADVAPGDASAPADEPAAVEESAAPATAE